MFKKKIKKKFKGAAFGVRKKEKGIFVSFVPDKTQSLSGWLLSP